MTSEALNAIVDEYFHRLDVGLSRLSPSRRGELIDEIAEHVREARAGLTDETEVSLRDLLDRVGRPEDIAAAARADDTHGHTDRRYLSRPLVVRLGMLAVVLAVIGSVLGVVLGGGGATPTSAVVAPTAAVGGFPTGIVFDPSTHTAYVADGEANSLSMINTRTCNAAQTTGCHGIKSAPTAGQDPIGVGIDDQTHTLYAVNGGSGSVAMIDTRSCNAADSSGCSRTRATIAVGGGPEFLAVNQRTNTIYVADTNSGAVSVIDGKRCNASETTACPSNPASVMAGAGAFPIAVDDSNNTVYVGTNDAVAVIDGRNCDASVVNGCSSSPVMVPVGSNPAGIAVDPTTDTVFVSSENGTVSIIDGKRCNASESSGCPKHPTSVTVGSDARGDAVDAAVHTLYVTNAGSNTVSLLDTSKCNASATGGCSSVPRAIPVGRSPRRVVVDPTTQTAYVVNVLGNTVSVIDAATCNAAASQGCPTASAAPVGAAEASPGAVADSNCSPTTAASDSGGPATEITRSSTEVARGTVAGHTWSLWSKKGETGARALEDGGLVLDNRSYGLCPGYPNPAELEMLDAGSRGIVYGVVGYPGRAKLYLSVGTVGSFQTGKALPSPEVRVVNGVSFFLGSLPKSACDYGALELNSTSPGVSAEHNLGFGSCVTNEIVPITASQGIWQLPQGHFPTGFGSGSAGSSSAPAGRAGNGGVANTNDDCSPQATSSQSGMHVAQLTAGSTEVASGTIEGTPWSLWAANGQSGVVAVEQGGFVVNGRWYGMCPGAPNPAEFEMIDASPMGIVYGYVANPGSYSIALRSSGQALPVASTTEVNGGTFFVDLLTGSACSYPSLDLTATTSSVSDQHHFDFGACAADQLVQTTGGYGSW